MTKKAQTDSLVEIVPKQLSRNHIDRFGYPCTVRRRYFPAGGRYFSPKLNVELLKEALTKYNAQMEKIKIIEKPNGTIFYKYAKKPPIILDVKDGKYYAT